MDRVYVGNLPADIRIKDIDDFFRPFGKLVAIDVNNRSNPAFAYVQFDSPRNALSAVRNRHGYDYEGYTLQVKIAEGSNPAAFEVRNQRRQLTPPPPPPMFNDFNSGGGNFGGNNSNFGGNNSNFGGNNGNFGGNNSNFGRNLNNGGGNFGGNNSNFGRNTNSGGNFGGNTSFGNFSNDNFLSSSSSFQRNQPSQNMIQYPSTNVRSIMPAQNNMIEYPNNNAWGSGGGSGAGNSNRGSGGNSRGASGMGGGNNFGNMGGGGGGEYSYNPNNNCYADVEYQDNFTTGLSGSGRKWFNRYIRKGYPPKVAREKALEHRTLPYLRDEPNSNSMPNNAMTNLPLPALENFGNKIMSLFSGNNAGNFGGNSNQGMSNFNQWGNNQGGYSNMGGGGGGQGPSNYRSGNRNEIRSLMPARGAVVPRNRGSRFDAGRAESGILQKMLAEIPTLTQQNQVAHRQFLKSTGILKKLEDKEAKVGLNAKEVADKRHNKQFLREYRNWKNKQGILPPPKEKKEKDKNKKPAEVKPSAVVKEPVPNDRKSTRQLYQEYQKTKKLLLQEVQKRKNVDGPTRRLSTSGKKRVILLKEKAGVEDYQEVRDLAMLPQEKLLVLVTLKADYEKRTGKSINDKTPAEESQESKDERASIRKARNIYRSAVKYLKKFEEHDLETLTGREKALLRICLRRKRRIDEEQGLPEATTRFDYLLTEVVDLTETEGQGGEKKVGGDEGNEKKAADSKEKEENEEIEEAVKDEENENANEDEAVEDLTGEPDNTDEKDADEKDSEEKDSEEKDSEEKDSEEKDPDATEEQTEQENDDEEMTEEKK